MQENGGRLASKLSNGIQTQSARREFWDKFTVKLYEAGNFNDAEWKPSKEEIRKKWSYIQEKEKKKHDRKVLSEIREKKQHAKGTGGGPPRSPIQDQDPDIAGSQGYLSHSLMNPIPGQSKVMMKKTTSTSAAATVTSGTATVTSGTASATVTSTTTSDSAPAMHEVVVLVTDNVEDLGDLADGVVLGANMDTEILMQDRDYDITATGNYYRDTLTNDEEIEVETAEDDNEMEVEAEEPTNVEEVNVPVTPLSGKKKASEKRQLELKRKEEAALRCANAGKNYYETALKELRETRSRERTTAEVTTKYYEELLQQKTQNLTLKRMQTMKEIYGETSDQFKAMEEEYWMKYPMKQRTEQNQK